MDDQLRGNFPKRTALPGLPFMAMLAGNIAVEGFSIEGWWAKIPFLSIAAVIAVFWAGMVFADLWNPNSQLRRFIRESRRCFRIVAIGRNLTIDTDENVEHIELFCVIEFKRNMLGPKLVVRLFQLIANGQTRISVVHQERLDEVVENETRRLRIGTVSQARPGAKRPSHSIWGAELPTSDLKPGQISIVGGNKEVIEISIDGSTYRIAAQPITNMDYRVMLNTEDDRIWQMLN